MPKGNLDSNAIDLNTLDTQKIWITGHSFKDFPNGPSDITWGMLVVLRVTPYITQTIIAGNHVCTRISNGNTWLPWLTLV